MMKTWNTEDQGYLVECRAMEGKLTAEELNTADDMIIVDTIIPPLLNKFHDVSEWPKTLPSKRDIEHHIYLK